jgi:hypothetical protein
MLYPSFTSISEARALRRGAILAGLVMLGVLAPRAASATPNFPPAIQSDLGLSYTPPCNICHATTAGAGPIAQPFGDAMVSAGLQQFDTTSLAGALTALEADTTSGACDGAFYIEQLKKGLNPNPPGDYINGTTGTPPAYPTCATPTEPAFGCGAQLAPGAAEAGGAEGAASLVALGLLLATGSAARRRKR